MLVDPDLWRMVSAVAGVVLRCRLIGRKSVETGGKANASAEIRQSPSLLALFHC